MDEVGKGGEEGECTLRKTKKKKKKEEEERE